MQNFIITLTVVILAVISLTVGSNLSTMARTSQDLKEDIEIALHDASLQINEERFANGEIVFDEDLALNTFKESFEANTGISQENYNIVEFQVFDHSNSSFPVDFQLSNDDFEDTFLYPSILAVIETSTGEYFYTSDKKDITRIASYSYKLKNDNPTINDPVVDSEPNTNGFHWVTPYTNNITSHYQPYRLNPVTNEVESHDGTDIASDGILNKPALSALDGTVTYAGKMSGYGNIVQISHANGLVTRYAHLNQINVTSGQNVQGGEVIGLIGNTGRSTGAHLHFETIFDGEHVNPLSFY